MAKWKYTKDKPVYSTQFLNFKEGEEKTVEIENWIFERAAAGYLFKCYVVKENGEPVDKIWCVWDWESTEALKKRLGVKYTTGTKEVTAVMRKNDDEESYFEFK